MYKLLLTMIFIDILTSFFFNNRKLGFFYQGPNQILEIVEHDSIEISFFPILPF